MKSLLKRLLLDCYPTLQQRAVVLPPQAAAIKGLTLIELLIAISILSVIAVLGWRGLDTLIQSRKVLSDSMQQTRNRQLIFSQLQSDCENVIDSSTFDRHFPNRLSVAFENNRLLLVRRVFTQQQPMRLQVVIYQLKQGKLTRAVSEATSDLEKLNILWRTAAQQESNPTALILSTRVISMEVKVWNTGTAPAGWRTMPSALRTENPDGAGIDAKGLAVALVFEGQANPVTKMFLLGVN